MTPAYLCAPANWAHHSWLDSNRPIRSERAASAGHALLFGRYPPLLQLARADLPPTLPVWPRPACARLCRIAAALGFAHSLRRVVAAPARIAFAAAIAPHLLGAIQRHPRAALADLSVEPVPSLFSRYDMTALGLALAKQAGTDPCQGFWWSLRLPRDITEAAQRYQVEGWSAADACGLLTDARHLMETPAC